MKRRSPKQPSVRTLMRYLREQDRMIAALVETCEEHKATIAQLRAPELGLSQRINGHAH